MRTPKYNFDTIPDRAGTGTLKYDHRSEVFGRADVIPMWIADMDFDSPPVVGEALRRRVEYNLYGYDIGGELSTDALSGWLRRRSGWNVEAQWQRYTTGVVAGLGYAMRAFTSPGDGVVIQPPVYTPFRTLTETNDRRVIYNPLRLTEGRFEIDFDNLDECLAGARAMILCNPHNPVGRVFTEEELRRVGELCEKHDVVILSDEIHSDLVFAPHHQVHIAAIDGGRFAERTITFVAPSKTFNIAGLSTSAAIIPSKAMRKGWDIEYCRAHVPDGTAFGHIALRAAYDGGESWLEEVLAYLRGNIDYVKEFLAERLPMIGTFPHEGTYLMWLDLRGLGFASHSELMVWLVREAALGLNSGTDFGREGAGFVRMNVATNRATLEKAMASLADAVARRG